MSNEQLPLFPRPGQTGSRTPIAPVGTQLYPESSLALAVSVFHEEMLRRGWSQNTISSFTSDLRLVMRYFGQHRALGRIALQDLNNFLTYLLRDRGVPCNPKSYHRRVTTLKVFFGWLYDIKVIRADPSASIPHQQLSTPLPEILYDDQVTRLVHAAQAMRQGEKPDTRPYLLILLILHTGIKKSECVNIALDHLDLADNAMPTLYIRYANPRYAKKERKLRLPENFAELFAEYRTQYPVKTHLFECTARNLEYVLHDLSQHAGLSRPVTFEMLRWTCAVRDLQTDMPPDHLRQKLGLSTITWNQTVDRLHKLSSPPL
ncbi:MAG: hypothetical protein EXR62_04770 [Chloroflexi bacterium]|nr:hypothetical protein [Chloroflexota bacterium]